MKNKTFINKEKHKRTMKRGSTILLFVFTLLLTITIVQAVEIESIKQGDGIDLYQTCNNCTGCNFTRIATPSNQTLFENIETTKDGTYYHWYLGGGNTTELGTYKYFYECGNAVESETGKISFQVTPSGRSGNDNIALFIIIIIIIYAVTFISFFGKNIPLSILTGMLTTFFGVWIVRNGIVIYRDNLTNYFGYVTMAIGAIIAISAIIAWIEETF